MKFTCPHCHKDYDVPNAKPGQQAKCKACGKYFFIPSPQPLNHHCTRCQRPYEITPELVGKTVTCPLCGFSEPGQASTQPTPPTPLSEVPLLMPCRCGARLAIPPDKANDYLRCPCGRQVIPPGSRLFYLRSLRRIALFFFWAAIIYLILCVFDLLSIWL